MRKDLIEFLEQLELGNIRAASKNSEGIWSVNKEVKEKILDLFKHSELESLSATLDNGAKYTIGIDKSMLIPRTFTTSDNIRLVPGSTVRRGAYIGSGCIMMPPSYINIGAYLGEGSMIDSNALIGSCAQIGQRVHISAGVQIGGVLEPIGSMPVIVEDGAFLGAGVILVDGVQIGSGAVIAPGASITSRTTIYDIVNKREVRHRIPNRAVVIQGSKPTNDEWGSSLGLSTQCAIIVKYRDEQTDAATALEDALR